MTIPPSPPDRFSTPELSPPKFLSPPPGLPPTTASSDDSEPAQTPGHDVSTRHAPMPPGLSSIASSPDKYHSQPNMSDDSTDDKYSPEDPPDRRFLPWLAKQRSRLREHKAKLSLAEKLDAASSGSGPDSTREEAMKSSDERNASEEDASQQAANADDEWEDTSGSDSPGTQQPQHEGTGEVKEKPTAILREVVESDMPLPGWDEDKQKLMRSIDRIHEKPEMTRGLLYIVASKMPEAREMIAKADKTLIKKRKDSTVDPKYFRKLSVDMVLANAILQGRRESCISQIFDDADSVDIQEDMPRDQPNEHPPNTDHPANDITTIPSILDNHTWHNPKTYEDPEQKAEKPDEIITPRDVDMMAIGWTCHCGTYNKPQKNAGVDKVMIGSVIGLGQSRTCANEACSYSREGLHSEEELREMQRELAIEKAAESGGIPIRGRGL